MSWYTFLLFIHIAFAVAWVGGGMMIQFFALRALRAGPQRLATLALDVEWVGLRVLTPASALAFVSGVLLVIEGPWSFGDTWITIGLVLYAVTFLGGAAFFGPESGRIGKLLGEQGGDSSEAQARIRRILVLSRLDLVLLFLILFDMAVKPDFGDEGAVAFGLGAAALAAGLILWRWSASRSGAEHPARSGG
jgi:uncharacterized membrane protein